jgi:hypothetical protein
MNSESSGYGPERGRSAKTGGILVTVLLAALAAGAFRMVIERQRAKAQMAQALAQATAATATANAMNNIDMNGPKFEWTARLAGDETTVTFTLLGSDKVRYKDIVLEGLTLGGIAPREQATLPIRVADLPAGTNHEFVLHYDKIGWIDDRVSANVLGTDWAVKPLDYTESWVAVPLSVNPVALKGGTTTMLESKGSARTTGVRVELDPIDAAALKSRRDAELKAKSTPR